MDHELIVSAAPQIHTSLTTRRIMLDVLLSLLPAAIAAVVLFGTRAAVLMAVCLAACVVSEALFDLVTGHKMTIGNLSAAVTGLLLALNLSTNVSVWECVVGSVFAIVVTKCIFGGLGKNFANPAISGRVFMLLCFSSVAGGAAPAAAELVSSATPLAQLAAGEEVPSLLNMFLGLRGGAMGETCILALLLGYAYLVLRGHIKWYVPAAFIGSVFCLYLLFTLDAKLALYQILSGGLFLGAIFMATDYVTTPITNKGKVVFALGCGVITFIIRQYCNYPEGVSFSILIMNLLTPWIEKFTAHQPVGGVKRNAKA